MIDLVEHTLDGVIRVHLPGSGVCDFQTLCGSTCDDGAFREFKGPAELVRCQGCMQQALEAAPYILEMGKRRLRMG